MRVVSPQRNDRNTMLSVQQNRNQLSVARQPYSPYRPNSRFMNQSRNPNLGALGEEDIRENSPNQIQRGRVWNDRREGLEREFRKMDTNNDNNVDLDELRSYLLGKLRETRGGLVDEAAK